MQLKHSLLYTVIFSTILCNNSFAEEFVEPIFSTDVIKTQEVKQNENTVFKKDFSDAISKFENLNIRISYNDFYKMITQNKKNDFHLMLLAGKTAELGFFDLANLAFSRVNDLDISTISVNNTKQFYFPQKYINRADILLLAELYSNIVYNDQAKETVTELAQYPRLLNDYDYANYIMALGYFKLNDTESAKKYIAAATKGNSNINYKILESKIFASYKKGKLSHKIMKEINSQPIVSKSLSNKIAATNEYILFCTAKQDFDKDYHLGKYYFIEGDYSKSAKTFQSALSKNKKNNAKLYGMLSRCYFVQGDYLKATEYAKKGYKISKNENCVLTMADLEIRGNNYKTALKYYKELLNNKELREESLEKMAAVYTRMSNPKRANDIYKELLEEYNNSYIAYYKIGLSTPEKEIDYLKKSVAINMMFQDGWIDLTRVMLDNNNIELAKRYITNANYLDDNNFRYYYYQSLLQKKENELNHLRNSKNKPDKVAHEVQYFNSRRP